MELALDGSHSFSLSLSARLFFRFSRTIRITKLLSCPAISFDNNCTGLYACFMNQYTEMAVTIIIVFILVGWPTGLIERVYVCLFLFFLIPCDPMFCYCCAIIRTLYLYFFFRFTSPVCCLLKVILVCWVFVAMPNSCDTLLLCTFCRHY